MNITNRLAPARNAEVTGWLAKAISRAGNTRRWVITMTPGATAVVANNYPQRLKQSSPNAVANACSLAVQGNSAQYSTQAVWPSPAANTTLDLTSAGACFGIYFRIQGKFTTMVRGAYNFQVLDNATVISEFNILMPPTGQVCEVIAFGVNSSGSEMNIAKIAVPKLHIRAAQNVIATPNDDSFYAEGLNERGLGDLTSADRGLLNI